jgi:hypothetical protein
MFSARLKMAGLEMATKGKNWPALKFFLAQYAGMREPNPNKKEKKRGKKKQSEALE